MYQNFNRLLMRKHRGYYLKYISIIHEIEIQSIAEIGVFYGKNAQILRQEFPHAHLYLVDPWKLNEEYLDSGNAVVKEEVSFENAYMHILSIFKHDQNVTITRKPSIEVSSLLPDNFDLIFIDANHSYQSVKEDITLFLPKVRIGGILAGHNFGRKNLPGVEQAVREIFQDDFLLGQDEVWLHIKKNPILKHS